MDFVQIPGPNYTIQESYTFQVLVFMYSVWAACYQMKLTGKCTMTCDITVYYINTNEIPGELSHENMISSHVKITCYLHT